MHFIIFGHCHISKFSEKYSAVLFYRFYKYTGLSLNVESVRNSKNFAFTQDMVYYGLSKAELQKRKVIKKMAESGVADSLIKEVRKMDA